MNICMVRHEQHTLQGGHLSLKLFKQLDKTFVHIHIDLVISASCIFFCQQNIPSLTVLSFPIYPVSAQRNTRCAINQMKWITPGLRSEHTGTYILRLALFTEPQLLGRRDGRGIRRWTRQGFKGISQPKSTPSSSVVHSYRLNQPSFSALGCPMAQLLHSSSNSFVVCANDLTLQKFTVQKRSLHERVLDRSPMHIFC